jgi:cysteine synthase B
MENLDQCTKLGCSIPERIGKTPLIRLEQSVHGLEGITLLGKAEWANPSGSVMDRAAVAMIRDAISRKLLTPGKTVLEASTGNTGVSLAMLGAALDFPVQLVMPSDVSEKQKRIVAALGARVDWSAPEQGIDGAIRRARELAGNDAARFCYLDQFSNDANWLAHYNSTGVEIWEQTAGRVTHFVAGVGTSGTFIGTARRLKEQNPLLKAISVHPDSPEHGIPGLRHKSTAIVPPIYNPHLASGSVDVEMKAACEMAQRLARDEGLLMGISSAAAIVASVRLAREEAAAGRGAVIVAILPDAISYGD